MKDLARIYCHQELKGAEIIVLEEAAFKHVKALRLKKDYDLILFNHLQQEYHATLLEHPVRSVSVKLNYAIENLRETALQITLGQAISKSQHFEIALQKAVELGVSCFVPLISQYAILNTCENWQKKLQRWQNIVIHASEQSGRSTIMQIAEPINFRQWLSMHQDSKDTIILDPTAHHHLSAYQLTDNTAPHVICAIGPEGGFSAAENSLAIQHGFYPANLGKLILRTETAAIATLAIINSKYYELQ